MTQKSPQLPAAQSKGHSRSQASKLGIFSTIEKKNKKLIDNYLFMQDT